MANPAALLYAQLMAWHSDSTADNARGTRDTDAWVRHRLAVRHLDAIDEILAEMQTQGKGGINLYQQMHIQWTHAVFAWPHGWGSPNSGKINMTALHHLDTLAGRLDDYLPAADDAGRERTRALVNEVQAAIDSDDSLPDEMKIHLRQMAEQLGWCLDNYAITGDFELKNAIDRLLITIGVTAQKSTQPGRWTTMVNTFVYPFVTSTAAQLTGRGIFMLLTGGAG